MVEIRSYGVVRHLRGTPTGYVLHERAGRVVHEGTSQSFWFRPLAAVLSEVPVDDRELPLLFHVRTVDFQDITVQATITFRFDEPKLAATRIDFSIDPTTGLWRAAPLDQAAQLLTELAQQHAADLFVGLSLNDALIRGVTVARERMQAGLGADDRVRATGITVIGLRVIAVRPESDVERALQTPTRELVQQEADRATYERRARAVERERAISENELQSKIELAVREERLVRQKGANERRRSTEEAAAARINVEAAAEHTRIEGEAAAGRIRVVGLAEADAEAARMAVVADLDQRVLVALAVRDLAGQMPAIGTLNLTPDLVTTALTALVAKA